MKAVWTLVGWFVQPGQETWKPHLPVHRNALSGDCFPEGGAELIRWLKWECFVLLIWDPSSTPPPPTTLLLLLFFITIAWDYEPLRNPNPPNMAPNESQECLDWLWWWWLPLCESPVEITGAKSCLPFISPSPRSAREIDDSHLFFPLHQGVCCSPHPPQRQPWNTLTHHYLHNHGGLQTTKLLQTRVSR